MTYCKNIAGSNRVHYYSRTAIKHNLWYHICHGSGSSLCYADEDTSISNWHLGSSNIFLYVEPE